MISEVRNFLKSMRWRKAKDNTHEYTMITWNPELTTEFHDFVSTIYKDGYKGKFNGTTYTYLQVDEYIYWTMNFKVEVTLLINRKNAVAKS